MESLPIFILLTLIFLAVLTKILGKKNSNISKNLPPGPWKLPLIGSIHHIIGSVPHHRLRDLAERYGPIMHLQLGELSNVIISSPEIAKEVMKTHDVAFAQRPIILSVRLLTYNFTDISCAPYGDYWRQLRKICTIELLSAKRVESFRPIREEQVSKLITSVSSSAAAGLPINFSMMVNSTIYSIISRTAFGKIWEGEDVFIKGVKDMVEAGGGFTLADLYPSIKILQVVSGLNSRLERYHEKIDQMSQSIMDQHRARKATTSLNNEDIVDVLLRIQDQGDLQFPLTDDNLKAVIMDMFVGGSETSSTVVEWAMSELMKNPRIMERTQEEVRRIFGTQGNVAESRLDELKYFKSVMKETLRLHPPFPLLTPRECREKCSIYGYEIPVKTNVIVNVWAMGRDPNYWNEPEKFNPERFIDDNSSAIDYKGTNFEFLPFGAGRRMCPGLSYGMMNVEFILAQLLFHFDWKLATGITPQNLDMLEIFGLVTKRKNLLQLIPIPYRHSMVN